LSKEGFDFFDSVDAGGSNSMEEQT